MDHDAARAADFVIAAVFFLIAIAIVYNAANKAEPFVSMGVRYWKRGTQ